MEKLELNGKSDVCKSVILFQHESFAFFFFFMKNVLDSFSIFSRILFVERLSNLKTYDPPTKKCKLEQTFNFQ